MALLEIKNVSQSFGGVKAVKNCSFTVEKGKITALIGPNGAGKTTLFNIIGGFLKPDSGKIIFEREDITRAAAWRRSRLGLSRTFQISRLFYNLSLRENFVLSIRQDDDQFLKIFFRNDFPTRHDETIREMMKFVGLKKSLDIPVREMSYGEQKLFDLSRALLNPHTLLLLDEPVAGVNPVVRSELKRILLSLKKKKETMLLIEHDMDFVRSVSDRIIVLNEGSVLADGKPEEVLREKKVLEAYLGTV